MPPNKIYLLTREKLFNYNYIEKLMCESMTVFLVNMFNKDLNAIYVLHVSLANVKIIRVLELPLL